jgi:hypothetical protein
MLVPVPRLTYARQPDKSVGALGHLDLDALPWQRMPHEHHPAGVRTVGQPGDAMTAVGDRTHVDSEPLADPGPAPRRTGPRVPGHVVILPAPPKLPAAR